MYQSFINTDLQFLGGILWCDTKVQFIKIQVSENKVKMIIVKSKKCFCLILSLTGNASDAVKNIHINCL